MRYLRNDRLAGPSADAMPPVFNFTILRGPIFFTPVVFATTVWISDIRLCSWELHAYWYVWRSLCRTTYLRSMRLRCWRWCIGRHLHRDTMRELPARPYRAVLWALPVQLADQPARRFETWIYWIWPNHKTWLAPPSLPWMLFIGFLGAKSRSLCAWQKASIC